MDRVVGDRQIFVEELRWVGLVGMDAAHACGGHNNNFGFFLFVEIANRDGITEVEFLAAAQHEILKSPCPKSPDNGRSDHAAVSGDVDARRGFHEF